ncbi:MAG: hypothetical protein NVSMB7_11540 [Chitinophagaceae bacterium]
MGCKGKKKQPADEESITTADFIEFFDEVKLPFTVADSSFEKKKQDTVSISYKTFTGIVPDTLLTRQFGKNGKPRFYPLGRISVKKQDTYLLLKAISPSKKAAYVLVFNKDKKFVTGLPLLVEDNNSATGQSAVMDNKLSVTTNIQRKTADGRTLYRKAAYAYISSAGAFALILTETNETEAKSELLNPIDTLPRRNKLAGDYRQNKLNLVSVRDSRKPGEILFFVHFEKDEGGCKGELKGQANIVAPGKAVYRQAGDPCELQFSFAGNTVSLKEDGCGSHRDIRCFFEGSFVRKPPARNSTRIPKTVKKK